MKIHHYHIVETAAGRTVGNSADHPVLLGTKEEYEADDPALLTPESEQALVRLTALLNLTVERARKDGKRYIVELADDATPFEHGVFCSLCKNLLGDIADLPVGINKEERCFSVGPKAPRVLH